MKQGQAGDLEPYNLLKAIQQKLASHLSQNDTCEHVPQGHLSAFQTSLPHDL